MDFIVTITDPDQLAGITWAREEYNAALPTDEEGTLLAPPFETDQDYVQWVMEQASLSYAQQKSDADWATIRSATEITPGVKPDAS